MSVLTPPGPLKIRTITKPTSLAKSMALTLLERESREVMVRGIGPAASRIFAEALPIAIERLRANGVADIAVTPSTEQSVEDGKVLTVLVWHIHAS